MAVQQREQQRDNARERVVEATLDLMQDRSVDELRIGDICKEAGVSRTAFYYYFTSKYDVLNSCILEACTSLDQIGKTLTWREGISGHLAYHEANQELLNKLHAVQLIGESYNEICAQHFIQVWMSMIRDFNGIELTNELDFQVKFWATANAFGFSPLFAQVDAESPDLVQHIVSCLPKALADAMDAPVLERRQRGEVPASR